MNIYYLLYSYIKNYKIRNLILRILLKKEGGYAYSPTIRKIYSNYYQVNIGYGTYGGCFVLENMRPNIEIGNYCSFANNVKIFRANHPYNNYTTHPVSYLSSFGDSSLKENELTYQNLFIGNDVWIGSNVIILPSCKKIGNGSIIGAGSIVTKEIEPYSIVAGNPAKVIKMRFDSNIIQKLEESKWWNMKKEELIENKKNLIRIVNGK